MGLHGNLSAKTVVSNMRGNTTGRRRERYATRKRVCCDVGIYVIESRVRLCILVRLPSLPGPTATAEPRLSPQSLRLFVGDANRCEAPRSPPPFASLDRLAGKEGGFILLCSHSFWHRKDWFGW